MKGKSFLKTLGLILFFMLFVFVEDASAYSFVDEKYDELTVVSIYDTEYVKPSEEDVDLTSCGDCSVVVNNPIPAKVDTAGFYNVEYVIKRGSNEEETLCISPAGYLSGNSGLRHFCVFYA